MATKAIEITVQRRGYDFVVRVFADGVLQGAPQSAHVGTVVRVRNKLANHWANHPDGPSVKAHAIPWPPEYVHGGYRR